MGYRLDRCAQIIGTTVFGLGGAYAILANPSSSRLLVALAGVIGILGLLGAFACLLLLWSAIVDDLRPRVVARRPIQPLALTTELGAFVGTRRFSQHPVRFWSGLVLNHRVFFGLLIFAEAREETFVVGKDPA